MTRCAACDLGKPEHCTGFVGVPVDGPKGQRVEECERTPDADLRWALYQTRIRLQMHLETFPSQVLTGTLQLVNDALEGKDLDIEPMTYRQALAERDEMR